MSFFKDLFGSKKTTNNSSANPFGDALGGFFSNLTTDQKCAILAFESSIANFAQGTIEQKEAIKIVTFEMKALNIKDEQLASYAQKKKPHRVDDFVDGLRSISDKSILDYTLYKGFGIASVCGNDKALGYFLHVFEQLGYTEDDVKNVIQKIELLGKHSSN